MSALAEDAVGRVPEYAGLHFVTQIRSAVSVEAQTVRMAAWRVAESGERSFALFGPKRAAISQLLAVVDESHENGGCEDVGMPISSRATTLATDFIRALPNDVQLPEFAWEPDGAISLDWIESRHHLFSVSIGEGYRLPYAWLDGAEAGHGVAVFDGESVPERILDGVRRIMQRGSITVRPI